MYIIFFLWISGKAALRIVHQYNLWINKSNYFVEELSTAFTISSMLKNERYIFHPDGGVIDLNDFFNLWDTYSRNLLWSVCGIPRLCTPLSHVSACLLFMHKSEMFWQENVKRAIFQCNDPFWSDCHRAEKKRKRQNRDQTMAMTVSSLPQKKVFSPSQCACSQLDDIWTH